MSNCLSDSRYSSAWPSHQRCRDVRCKSALSVGEASLLKNGQDLPLHFHCSLIKSLLRPNQQVCSRLVSGFLPYPQGLWNEGQWVCYCFSLPLYPLIALWCQQWSDRESWALEKKNPQRGNNCYYDSCACLSRAAIVPVGIDVYPYEEGKEVNITYPPPPPNRSKWNSSSWQRAPENIEFGLQLISKHILTVTQMVKGLLCNKVAHWII